MNRARFNPVAKLLASLGLALAFAISSRSTTAADVSRGEVPGRRLATRGDAQPETRTPTPAWFEDHLADPVLRELALNRYSDHHRLTRADMLAIFRNVAENKTIDADQFQTLSTLVKNARFLGMSAYVVDLSRKVVLGDPANANFQQQPLGNLKVGSSASQLDRLVRKWFLGEDSPALDSSLHYEKAAGVLFEGAPKLRDLHQGDLGDCYFIATLGEVALRNPEQVAHMFIDNRDGTFTVRFFHDGKPWYVTVDRQLPVNDKGRFVYENRGDAANNPKNILWVALAEKALAQLNESGWFKTVGPTGVNSFAAIGAGGKSKLALPLVTGLGTARDGVESLGGFAKGELELANSKPDGVPAYLIPHHSYVVVGYDADNQQVTLFNPWGLNGSKKDIKYGQFNMSWNDFAADFQNIDHAATHVRTDLASTKSSPKNMARTAGPNAPHIRTTGFETGR
jgi:hypothetical protein